MARGNEIVLTANPKGVFKEGTLSGATYPGSRVQVKAGAAESGGRPTFEAGSTSGPVMVLNYNWFAGKTASDQVPDLARAQAYAPAVGEELNVRLAAASYTIGQVVAPWTVMEAVTVPSGGGLVFVTYNGGDVLKAAADAAYAPHS